MVLLLSPFIIKKLVKLFDLKKLSQSIELNCNLGSFAPGTHVVKCYIKPPNRAVKGKTSTKAS